MRNFTVSVAKVLVILLFGLLSTSKINHLQAQTITTLPVPLSFCSCDPVSVSYTATGVFNAGNIFLVQLSNAVGNFAGATNIGNINSNALSGTIPCVIPCNTPYGTGYRIRIISNSPFVIGSDNGANITINPSPIVSIALTNGNCVDTLTAVVQGANVGVPNGNKYYITNNPPWGSPSNVNEMNAVFGAGNWIQSNFSANAATIFVPGTQFVFLEGSDGNAIALNTFITANIALIQNWVFAGGRLFLNSAPNQGGVQNWGFGGTQLNYINLIPPVANNVPGVNISNLGHPINVGPFLPLNNPSGVYTANYFAHANVVNGGTTLIHSSANSNFAVLAEKTWGAGLVLFGGMTTSNWHNNVGGLVNAHAVNLRQNILHYTAGSVIQPTYTYLWNTGATTQKIIPVASGIYTVTVTSTNGCTGTATYNYTAIAPPPVVNITQSGALCTGGVVVLNAGPGFASYLWDNGLLSQTRTIAAPGTYWVTVTNAQGCTASDTITITLSPNINLAAAASPPIACNGGTTTIFAIANGGVPGFQYSFNGGPFGPSNQLVGAVAGIYTVTVQDAAGCTKSTVLNINQPPPMNVNATAPALPCNGLTTITVNVTGGLPAYQYALNGGPYQFGNQFFNVAAGIYTVTVLDANNCTATSVMNIAAINSLSVAISNITNVTCNPLCNGTALATGSGGQPAYTFAITAPGVINVNTGAISALCAGTYTVTITDATSCTATTSFTITQPAPLTVSISNITNVSCAPLCNGTAQAAALGGTPGYLYTITAPGIINVTGNISGLCAGNYTVTATDAVGCTGTTSFTVTQAPALSVSVSNITNVTCNGLCNGTAQAVSLGGTPGYLYSITAPGVINVTGSISALCAGTYTVTSTDAAGCTATTSFTVTAPPALSLAISNIVNVTCSPLCNGTAQASAAGGTPGYTYSINAPGVINVTGNITGLCAGTYTVTVTDANSCSTTASFSVTQPPAVVATITNTTNPSCAPGCDGTATVVSAGGIGVITYSIFPAAGPQVPVGTFTGLCAGTNYVITATDANGCTGTTNVSLSTPNGPVPSVANITNVSCFAACDGTAQASATGGTPAYGYSITAPGIINAVSGAITGLCAGSYTVTVTDANSCVGTTSFTVTQPNLLTINTSGSTAPNCVPGCNGTATTTTAGGTPIYTYTISGGAAINALGNASNLCAGITYTITVTDAELCTATTTILLNAPNAPTVTISNITNVTCNGLCNGSAQANAVGGAPAYTFGITAPGVINVNTGAISALCAGTYTVTVTDANFCTATTSFTITQAPLLTVSVSNIVNINCNGNCDGTAQATAIGGTNPIVYSITAPGLINANLGSITALCAGTYTVTATDANLCIATTTFTVTQPPALTVSISNILDVTCNGVCDGSAQANALGGTNPITYSITAPGIINPNTGAISALCAGTYTVTATDGNSCTATTSFTISQPPVLAVAIFNIVNVTCNGSCDGTSQSTALGGTLPYTYAITAPGITNPGTGANTALCAGTYTVTVTDANLCTATTSFTVTEPPLLTVTVSNVVDPTCNGNCDGTGQGATVGGVNPVTYAITAPGIIDVNTGAISGLCAGSYTVTATDANSCTATTVFVVGQPTLLTVSVTNITVLPCFGDCTGTAQAAAAGGSPNYTYAITAPGVIDVNTGAITALCAGAYLVTVTDANLCTATTVFNVTQPAGITVTITNIVNASCNAACDGTALTNAIGGNPAYTYSITAPGIINVNTGAISGLCAGSYTVTVTDANNCTGTSTLLITEPIVLTVDINVTTGPSCVPGCDGTATTTTAGGTAAYSYAISGGATINGAGTASNLCAGTTYTITVTDANNCIATTTVQLIAPSSPTITINTTTAVTCVPGCDGTATTISAGGTPGYTYSITGGGAIDAVGTASNLCAAITYTITVTDANGCTGTTTVSLVAPTSPTITINNTTTPTCVPGCDGTATTNTIGGTPAYSYAISGGAVINAVGTASNLCAGITYTITVTDANNCSATTTVQLIAPNAPTITINTTTAPTCVPGCDGTATTITAGGTPGYLYAISGGAAIDALGNASNLCAGIVYTITVTDANSCSATTTVQLTAPNAPTITINTTTPVTCVPGCDGTATTITAGGTPGYTYAISGGAVIDALGNASNLCAGIVYTITVTDANACTGTTTVQLVAPSSPAITINTTTAPTCVPGCDGTATTNTVGGTPAYSYAISGGAVIDALGNASNLCAGTIYTITVTDANSCSATTTVQLIAPNAPTITINTTTGPTCVPGCDGTATTNTVGGAPSYTYAISGGATIDIVGTAGNLCAGTVYTITVTDASGCTGTTTVQLAAPSSPTVTITNTTNPSCTPGCDGTATVSGAGGNGPIVFTISPAAGPQVPVGTFTGLCAGTNYIITGTDANGCTGTTNISLSTPNSPTVTVSNITSVSCFGDCNATAQATAIGGTPGYTYSITAPGIIDVNTGAISGLCVGSYTVTVTDASSCVGTTNFVVSGPALLTVDINVTTTPTCTPGCDGTATTTTAGGTAGYTYAISGGAAINGVGTASNLCAGTTYTITVTDANSCSATTTVQLTAPNAPTITINTTTPVTCVPGCDGTATTNTAGGTPTYTYAISGGAAIDALGNASNLCGGTVYTITVTDANSCSATTTVQLIAPNSPTISINTTTPVTCVPGCDGTATTITAGGTPGYTYAISGGAAIDALGNASNLCAGIVYTITVTDANSCSATTTVQLIAPNSPTITINTTTPVTCVPGCDGTATTITAGGTPGYTYAISGGALIDALGNASNLCAGIVYTITVTDANACSGTTTVQLTAPNAPTITINTTTAPTCVPGCDGTATTNTVGGTPAYSYAISGGAVIDALGNASNLCAGTIYTITVTDANSCSATTTVQLIAPNAPTITTNTTTGPTCVPGCDGTATTNTVGGAPTYTYAISGGATIDVVGAATNLCAGTIYTITVTDASGCTGTTTVQLAAPSSPTVTITNTTNPSCTPGCDGTATVSGAGGNGPIVFTISPAAGPQVPVGTFTNLCAGINYVITGTDANGCTGTTNISLSTPNSPTVTVSNITSVSCFGDCNGVAQAAAIGGTPGYTYSITAPGIIDVNTGAISGLCVGSYTVTVTDASSCVGTTNFVVSGPALLTVDINVTTTPTCTPGCDGTATTTTAGGTAGYTYAISGGAAINGVGTASNLCAGTTYTITVTDANSCSATTTVQLTAPNAPTITINTTTPVTCVPGCDGTATTNTAGGTPTYTYAISGGAAIDALGNASNLCGGTVYTITVTDANSCSATTTVQLIAPNSPTISINTTTPVTCVPGCDGTATTITAGGTPGYTYTISGGAAIDALGNASNLCAGIVYTITVTDANSCSATTTVQLTAPNAPTITINTTTPVTCVPGCDGTATTNTAGGTPGYTYAISGGAVIDALGNASNLCAGIVYTITVTDANACSGTTTVQLTAPNAPTITINTTTAPTCVPGCDGTATTTTVGGTPGYTYAITGGATINAAGNASNLCGATVYTITVTDANGCSATTTVQLIAPNAPIITVNATTGTTCVPGCDGTATTAVVGVNPPYAYAITGGALINAAGAASNLCSGTIYTITATDASGCTATTTVQLAAPNAPTVTVTAFTNVTVFGGADGTITVAAAGGTPGYVFSINPAVGAQAPAGNFINLTAPAIPGPTCYTITVTDASGCTATTVQCITQPPIANLVVTGVPTSETCFGKCDGIITTSTTGGAAPYSYVLLPGNIPSATGIYSNLCVGTYTITSTDVNNATGSTVVTVGGPTQIQWTNATPTDVTCFGAANGSMSVNATGGMGGFMYSITPLAQANALGIFTPLTPQCYTITATDGNGCTLTATLCIAEPPQITFAAVVAQDNSCNGGLAGTITVAATGGNPLPNYSYVLTPGGQNNQTGQFTGLGAGTYTVTVTDGNGCTATTGGIVINEPAAIVYNTVNVHEVYCYGDATGSIAVVASGGTGAITFSITPNATQLPLGFFKDLLAGSYVITATDANGCTLTTQATIVQNPALQITSLTVVEPICAYDTTGVLDIKATGGTAPITFSLNNGTPKLSGLFTGLPVGVYQITLLDDLGCRKDTNLVLSGPTAVGATMVIDDPKCIDSKDGRVTVVGTGGRGGYKYYITPGLHINKTGQFYDLAAGTYTLRVVDTVGCEYMVEFTINPPANPLGNTMTKQDLGCTGKGNEGTATANTFGGQPPYVYQWSTSPVQNSPMASNLYFGWYNVLIADANGCEYRDSVYIEEGPCCDVSFIPNAFSPNGDNNNDEFKVFSTAGIILIQLEVYDRWGQKLWSTSDWKRGWDGKIDGEDAEVSTYQYIFRYTCTRDGKTYIRKGDVTLIR